MSLLSYPFTLLTQFISVTGVFSPSPSSVLSLSAFSLFLPDLFLSSCRTWAFYLLGRSSVSSPFASSHTFFFLSNMQHLLSFSFHIHPGNEWLTWICLFSLQPLPSAAQEHLRKPIVWLPPRLACPHLRVWVQVCVIEPGAISESAFVCWYCECAGLGGASSGSACGSQFVGGDGCVWVSACMCTFCTVFLSVCQAGSLNWILASMYCLFHSQKEVKIISRCQCLERMCIYCWVCVCVCDIFYVHSVWYVVYNCLCLTIHHRAVFLTLSLLSSVTNLFSLLAGRKSRKLFFKITLTSVFFFFFKPNKCTHNKLSRKRLHGGWRGRKKHHICQAGKQSRQIALSCQRVWHHQNTEVPPWENEKHCTDTKHSIVYKLYAHLFSRYFNWTLIFATCVSKMQLQQLFCKVFRAAAGLMDALTWSSVTALLSEY